MRILAMVSAATAFVVAALALSTVIFMWLWNWIAVGLFGAPVLTFWTALGLSLLISMLTGGVKFACKKD